MCGVISENFIKANSCLLWLAVCLTESTGPNPVISLEVHLKKAKKKITKKTRL